MNSLEQEMVAGKGEKLDAFANLLGCPASRTTDFGNMTRSNYKKLAKFSDEPSKFLVAIKQEIKTDKVLARSCKVI